MSYPLSESSRYWRIYKEAMTRFSTKLYLQRSLLDFYKEHPKGGHFASAKRSEELKQDTRNFVPNISEGKRRKLQSQDL
ncbi:hypothetical protein CVT25_011079 [Psilocybe cyanescens]|uniref:Uncharacterized protein n=1 Tax=Psilocybe cyanescens TaxID=93625 RepID=A0A409WFH5_PSICY|nr:hypothetical protein CVT25_011079 [Psilocybe cyanescens]